MPLVFGAHAGSMLTLTGTPVNVIVANYAAELTGTGFGFFEFALAGIPLLIGCMAFVLLLGPRLLPERRPKSMPADLSRHARTLVEQYDLADSKVAREVAATGETATHLDLATALVGPSSGLAEVMIPPRSPLIGETAFPGMVTESGDLVVLAVARAGEELGPRETRLAAGDLLLLQGTWDAIEAHAGDRSVLAVDSPEAIRRQAVPLGPGAGRALLILGGMIVLLATGIVPSAVAGLLAAGLLVLTRVLSPETAYRGISWTTVVLVAGMIPLSTAMTETGAAGLIADGLVAVVGTMGPYALLAGLFIVTAVFGQLISNMATALIVIPVAIAAAADLGVDVRPVLMSVTIAASAAYLTPVATPVNLMVMGPAGYRFGDYWKLGLPLLGVTFVVAVFVVPLIWPL
jgi:di/tricarboxylate transporter